MPAAVFGYEIVVGQVREQIPNLCLLSMFSMKIVSGAIVITRRFVFVVPVLRLFISISFWYYVNCYYLKIVLALFVWKCFRIIMQPWLSRKRSIISCKTSQSGRVSSIFWFSSMQLVASSGNCPVFKCACEHAVYNYFQFSFKRMKMLQVSYFRYLSKDFRKTFNKEWKCIQGSHHIMQWRLAMVYAEHISYETLEIATSFLASLLAFANRSVLSFILTLFNVCPYYAWYCLMFLWVIYLHKLRLVWSFTIILLIWFRIWI